MKREIITACCTLLISGSVLAAEYSGWTYISQLGTGWSVDRTNIYVEDAVNNPANCNLNDFYQVDEDAPQGGKVFSIALTAFASGKEVNILYDETSCSYGGRPKVISILIR